MNGNGSAPNGLSFWRSLAIGSVGLLIGLGAWIYTADRTAGAEALLRVEERINGAIVELKGQANRDHERLIGLERDHGALVRTVDDHGQRLAAVERKVRP